MAECQLRVAGPEVKASYGTTQLALGVEAGIEGAIHVMRVLWEEHIQEKHWVFLLFERVARVNEEKYPIFLLFVFLPEDAHHMDGALYPLLQASRQVRRAAGSLGLQPGYLQ